jgi:hypothetical protein
MHTRRPSIRAFVAAAAFAMAVAACGGSTLPSAVPSIAIPTLPPGSSACLDAPTMAILDQLRATGADVPALLAANKDALIGGLNDLESTDPNVTAWRDALVGALQSGDMDAAAAEIAKLANDEVTIAPC